MSSSAEHTPLSPGTRLGPYEIIAPLGSGGMGEVYRARDTKLNREVAIKVLPSSVAGDGERLARFRREAQLLASLNHPHIGAIYGVEDAERVALILELVDGVTLAERIGLRPIPWKEAVPIAIQIADGLEAAHSRAIIHRDLKPANVKIASSGRVKVLDFGLAKPAGSDSLTSGETTAAVGFEATRDGIVVGTIGYMSPEQARGHTIDKRTDVWAFGCVLFEMLAGRAPFAGSTPTDTLAAIVEREPDWNQLPAIVPKQIVDIVRRCLAKDPRRRFHDLADVRMLLEDALEARPSDAVAARSKLWVPVALGVLAGAMVTAVVAGLTGQRLRGPERPLPAAVSRLVVIPDDELAHDVSSCAAGGCGSEGVLALSPDGRQIVYAAGVGDNQRLYLRVIDQYESRPIPGTEGGRVPSFSPDGRSLAFIAGRKLKKVSLDGGAPVVLREFVEGDGVSWSDNGNIYFSPGLAMGVWSVPSGGGTATSVTTITSELQHRFAELLPGGKVLLYSGVTRPTGTGEQIMVEPVGSGQRKIVLPGASPHYVSSGHLVYGLSGQLMAVKFDLTRLEPIGPPSVVVDHIEQTLNGTPQYAVSRSGALVYVPARREATQSALVWVDLHGADTPANLTGRPYVQPRLAPDGRRVALALRGNSSDIWEYDLVRQTTNRMTFDNLSSFPVWSPDGRRLAFSSGKLGPSSIFWKPTDGSQPETQLTPSDQANLPLAWSPDGSKLAFVAVDPQTAQDIWIVDFDDKERPRPFLQTRFGEGAPVFSPDGRWIAYVSNESGRNEVYVRPASGEGDKWTISTGGGNEPVWAKKAPLLFYREGDAMMVVDVQTTPEFSAGRPRRLFDRPYDRSNAYWPNFDVTPDGQKLLMLKTERSAPAREIDVVLNWQEDLKRRLP